MSTSVSQTIFSDCYEYLSLVKNRDELLHKYHMHYEQPIFDHLRKTYLTQLKKWWSTYDIPNIANTDRCIVIYETRCHPNLEFLIYNLTYFAQSWGLIIFCSKDNYAHISDILCHNKDRAIINIVRDDEGGREVRNEYNEFVKSQQFWDSLPCKYVLMCEMDAYLRKKVPDDIVIYDYVCCYWPWNPSLSGGGGISFRKVESMKKISNVYPQLATEIFAQDSWVAEGCNRLELVFNNSYLVEADHDNTAAIGFHNWWTFINPINLQHYSKIYDAYLTLEYKAS